MAQYSTRTVKNLNLAALIILLIALGALSFMTHNVPINSNVYWTFVIAHHNDLMLGLVIVSLILGFLTAQYLYGEILQKKKASQEILGTVLLFLNKEEREIVNSIVKKGGETTQAEIARLPGMNRVKAYRSLQKMQEKQLLDIIPHGKLRKVRLKQNILSLLIEEPQKA